MDTPPTKSKSWSQLTARARQCPVPEIDVRFSVRAAITSASRVKAPARPAGLFAEISLLTQRGWFAGSLAALTLLAGISGYIGLRAVPEISLALGFSSMI